MKLLTLAIAAFLSVFSNLWAQSIPLPQVLQTLSFGSCNQHFLDQSYWPNIKKQNPDLWIWLGDIIYTDNFSAAKREEDFNIQKNNPFYYEFRTHVPVVGVWDDHDYGDNDSDRTNPLKKESQKSLWNFLDYGPTHHHYNQKGVYQSYHFGEEGKKVLVVLFDLRYFRDRPYINGTMLGDVQWKWFENIMKTTTANLIILGSSSQVLPKTPGESWTNYNSDKKRLLTAIKTAQSKNKKVLILSGDRHYGEILRDDLGTNKIYEISSSGLTHFNPEFVGPSTLRLGKPLIGKNFGTINIQWKEKNQLPILKLNLHNLDGTIFESVTY